MLSEKIKELRKKEGLTQEQLAEKLNVSRQAIAKWESGHGTPDIENIKNISHYFHVSIDYLLDNKINKDVSLKNKFSYIEVFVFLLGICFGIISKSFEVGFICSILLTSIVYCIEIIVLDYKYRKENDFISQRELLFTQLPTNFYGRPLNIDPQSKKERIKWYSIESILFASIMTLFEIVGYLSGQDEIISINIINNPSLDIILSCIISFIILFLISFIIDSITYEYKIKKYNNITKG